MYLSITKAVNPTYNEDLKKYLNSPADPEKAKNNFSRIFASDAFFKIEGDQKFVDQISQTVLKVLEWKGGRELFKKIAALKILITLAYGESCKFSAVDSTIHLKAPNKFYYFAHNENQELILVKRDQLHCSLVHELIHAYIILKDPFNSKRLLQITKVGQGLLDEDFDTMHEQVVITGIWPQDKRYRLSQELLISENLYLTFLNEPLRISHSGKPVKDDVEFSIADFILCGCEATLKTLPPFDVNTSYVINDPKSRFLGKKLTPVNAACYAGRVEFLEELISKGAHLEFSDDLGTPFEAAIKAAIENRMVTEISLPKGKMSMQECCDFIARNRPPITRLLTRLNSKIKIDFSTMVYEGKTAMEIAIQKKNKVLIRELMNIGAKIPEEHLPEVQRLYPDLFRSF